MLEHKDGPVVDVLVLRFRKPQMENRCIMSLIENAGWPHNLLVLENSYGIKNMARIWNRFIVWSDCCFVAVVDSDTCNHSQDWLRKLMDVFSIMPDAGVVVPVTNRCGEKLQMQPHKRITRIDHGHASGFCFVMRIKAWEDAGPFDENFEFYGQDAEFFVRMVRTTGWRVYIQPEAYVEHLGAGSVEMDDEYDFKKDKQDSLVLFYRKTGGVRQT